MTTETKHDPAIAARFETFRKEITKLSQEELAKEAGMNKKTISFIETSRSLPNQKLLSFLGKKYKLNSEWLAKGVGEPVQNKKPDNDSIANMQARLSSVEMQLARVEKLLLTVLGEQA